MNDARSKKLLSVTLLLFTLYSAGCALMFIPFVRHYFHDFVFWAPLPILYVIIVFLRSWMRRFARMEYKHLPSWLANYSWPLFLPGAAPFLFAAFFFPAAKKRGGFPLILTVLYTVSLFLLTAAGIGTSIYVLGRDMNDAAIFCNLSILFVAMQLTVVFFILLIATIEREHGLLPYATAMVAAFSLLDAFLLTKMNLSDAKYSEQYSVLRGFDNMMVPNLKDFYLHGAEPDLFWTGFCATHPKIPSGMEGESATRVFLETQKPLLDALDETFAPNRISSVKCAGAYDSIMPKDTLRCIALFRDVMGLYRVRIRFAAAERNSAETFRLWSCTGTLVRSALDSLDVRLGLRCEEERLRLLEYLAGQNLFDAATWNKIERSLSNTEAYLNASVMRDLQKEVYFSTSFMRKHDRSGNLLSESASLRWIVNAPLYCATVDRITEQTAIIGHRLNCWRLYFDIIRKPDWNPLLSTEASDFLDRLTRENSESPNFDPFLAELVGIHREWFAAWDRIAVLRMIRIVCRLEALRMSGKSLPHSLDELDALPCDPYSGGPFRFETTARGYRMWSVGRNRRDDSLSRVFDIPVEVTLYGK